MRSKHSILGYTMWATLLVCGSVLPSVGANLNLAWDPPLYDEAFQPMDESLVGFKVYFGTASNHYDHCLDVGNATTTTLTNLQEGATYYIAVSAYANVGGESDCSAPLTLYSPDVTPPVLTIAETVVVIADASGRALVPDLRAGAVVTDNCSAPGEVVLCQEPAGLSAVGYGITPVIVRAIDGEGNETEKAVQLIVKAENGTDGDLDADALADEWETEHFGSLVAAEGDADADADGDGALNLAEYVAGTDPRDEHSVNALRLGADERGLTLAFDAPEAAGPGYEGKARFFRLEACADLGANKWAPVEGYENIAARGQMVACPIATPDSARTFYRTQVWLQ